MGNINTEQKLTKEHIEIFGKQNLFIMVARVGLQVYFRHETRDIAVVLATENVPQLFSQNAVELTVLRRIKIGIR